MLEKHPNDLNRLRKVSIILVLLSILTLSAATMVPSAKAGPSLSLNPSAGASGPYLYVSASGFGFAPNSQVTLSVFNVQLAKVQASSDFGSMQKTFLMPISSPGSYTITATDDQGNTAQAQFLVLGGSGSTPTPASPPPTQSTSNPTTAPTQSGPTPTPYNFATVKPSSTPIQGEGFWSPTMIGVVIAIVVVAVLVPSAFFFMRRGGGRKELTDEAPPAYPTYGPSPPAAGPQYNAPSYGQPAFRTPAPSRYQSSSYSQNLTRPTMSRPGMPSSYGAASSGAMRVCPRCRHSVKDYYSICPYCRNKLK